MVFLFTVYTNTFAVLPSTCSPVYGLNELPPSDSGADAQLAVSTVSVLSQPPCRLGFSLLLVDLNYILSPRQVIPNEIEFHFLFLVLIPLDVLAFL